MDRFSKRCRPMLNSAKNQFGCDKNMTVEYPGLSMRYFCPSHTGILWPSYHIPWDFNQTNNTKYVICKCNVWRLQFRG